LEDLFLIPKIMGKRMGLNPALILLSLSVWGALLGVVGMIMALPLTTLIISYYKRYILVGLNQMESEEKQAEPTLSKPHPAEDVHVEKEE
jgi:predicted PurR-regulated permease PerM